MADTDHDVSPQRELATLVESGNYADAQAYLKSISSSDALLALARLAEADQARLLASLPAEEAAFWLQQLPDVQAAEVIDELSPEAAADIIEELPSDQQADLVAEIEPKSVESILTHLEPESAGDVRALIQFPADEAGGLMVKEFLAFEHDFSVAQVLEDLRSNADRYRNYQVQYAYVVDDQQQLVGVLRLRDLLLEEANQAITGIMIKDPFAVKQSAPLDELRDFFDEHRFLAVPVLDDHGRFTGVLRRSAVEQALADHYADDYRKAQGIVKEELRTMPMMVRSRRRLSWLSVNILLNIVAASVIAFFQETLAQVIALAVFLPIISDMSGCSGNQAVAVSMRELALGLVRPNEVFWVWMKEVSVGMINGIVLGLLIASAAWLWQGTPWLGLVVGVSMAINTVVAVSLGGTLPLLIRKLDMDPALASGPILTTVTDMCGFFLVLGLATAMLPWLTN